MGLERQLHNKKAASTVGCNIIILVLHFSEGNPVSLPALGRNRDESLGKTYRNGVISRCNLAYLMVKWYL